MEPRVTIIRNCQRNDGKSMTMLDGKGREVWDCPGRGCPCGAPKKEKLSPMQKRIISEMRRCSPAAFTGERARVAGFGVFDAKHGGIIIRAYQHPEYFLKHRGFIERVVRDVPGYWFVLTAKGQEVEV